jgi:hypothetical protein
MCVDVTQTQSLEASTWPRCHLYDALEMSLRLEVLLGLCAVAYIIVLPVGTGVRSRHQPHVRLRAARAGVPVCDGHRRFHAVLCVPPLGRVLQPGRLHAEQAVL